MAKPAIIVDQVGVLFNLNNEKIDNIRSISSSLSPAGALQGVLGGVEISFTVAKGELGVLGLNGAGKTR